MPAFILRQKNNYCDAVIYKKDIMVASLVAQIIHNLPAMQENTDSIPALGRSPGEGNGNPLQYSCLENSMDRGAWWITVHGVAKESDTT